MPSTLQSPYPKNQSREDVRSDLELVEECRRGDREAYAVLCLRHWDAGIATARAVTWSFDAEDLVVEALTRILAAIKAGGGPRTAFRAYLRTAIRNVACSWSQEGPSMVSIDDVDELPRVDLEVESTELLELAAEAFRSLPERWRDALWCSEIEGMSTAEMAVRFQLTPNAIAALTFRARDGLRRAYAELGGEGAPALMQAA